jgi:hypothetical protein
LIFLISCEQHRLEQHRLEQHRLVSNCLGVTCPQIPVGALVEAGVLPVAAGSAALPTDAASIAALFNQTCAPQV